MHKKKNKETIPQRVALMGMPGCGKSTIGKLLSENINITFFDSDELIESEAGKPIPEIFEKDGEKQFRKLEKEVISGLFLEPDAESFVLSVGGGAVMTPEVHALLYQQATLVFVETPLDILNERLLKSAVDRPLLRGDDPKKKIAALYEERLPVYRRAHIILNNRGTAEQAANDLMELICN